MKFNLHLAILIGITLKFCVGKLLPCSEVMQEVCTTAENYVSKNIPEPFPTKIDLKLKLYEIIEVDETQQTVTLSMKAMIEWHDGRLDVNRSKDYIDRYNANFNFTKILGLK